MIVDIDLLKGRLKLFLENETYAYIQDIFKFNFNGRVLEVYDKKFLFLDDVLGKIEINFSDVVKVNYSNRGKEVGDNDRSL
ncbi:hypothetical protein LCGC14_1011830 [marine sediment metagenome]|uniref:Uncharacterized protein n=1 Tax=marine sediment metagenome TaxID=412755 RepID=A0A0F9NLF9_9ZZZZ